KSIAWHKSKPARAHATRATSTIFYAHSSATVRRCRSRSARVLVTLPKGNRSRADRYYLGDRRVCWLPVLHLPTRCNGSAVAGRRQNTARLSGGDGSLSGNSGRCECLPAFGGQPAQ